MTTIEETPEDPRVREEEDAAAAEAGSIGGRRPEYEDEEGDVVDEETRPLIESGEGVEEGSRRPRATCVEAATHGENRYDPSTPGLRRRGERRRRATPCIGEPDEIDVTETVRDPEAGLGEDPGEGPGISTRCASSARTASRARLP